MKLRNMLLAVTVICGAGAGSVAQPHQGAVATKRILLNGSLLPPTSASFTGGIPPVCPTGSLCIK